MTSQSDPTPREPKPKPERPRSEAQRAASRANGARSAGPKSPAGKARSSFIALKPGLCADNVVLPGESQEAYRGLRLAYHQRFQPADGIEGSAVDLLVKLDWQIGRAAVDEHNAVFLRIDAQRPRFDREFENAHPSLRITRARQVEMRPGEFGDILDRHLGRLDRAYSRALQRLHFIKTKFPLPQELPDSQSEAPTQAPTLNLRNEPEPPATPLESTPAAAVQPTQEPVAKAGTQAPRPVSLFSGYMIGPVPARAPQITAETTPETASERPQPRCAAA